MAESGSRFPKGRLLPSLLSMAVIEAADWGLFEKDELIDMLAHLGNALRHLSRGAPTPDGNGRP